MQSGSLILMAIFESFTQWHVHTMWVKWKDQLQSIDSMAFSKSQRIADKAPNVASCLAWKFSSWMKQSKAKLKLK